MGGGVPLGSRDLPVGPASRAGPFRDLIPQPILNARHFLRPETVPQPLQDELVGALSLAGFMQLAVVIHEDYRTKPVSPQRKQGSTRGLACAAGSEPEALSGRPKANHSWHSGQFLTCLTSRRMP